MLLSCRGRALAVEKLQESLRGGYTMKMGFLKDGGLSLHFNVPIGGKSANIITQCSQAFDDPEFQYLEDGVTVSIGADDPAFQ